jgi:hypothetical protein
MLSSHHLPYHHPMWAWTALYASPAERPAFLPLGVKLAYEFADAGAADEAAGAAEVGCA